MSTSTDQNDRTGQNDEVHHFGAQFGEQFLTLSQLCVQLQVSPQTLYDLRSQGRGPSGFRVGRELRFRLSEIEDWVARMESDDRHRHQLDHRGGRR